MRQMHGENKHFFKFVIVIIKKKLMWKLIIRKTLEIDELFDVKEETKRWKNDEEACQLRCCLFFN